MERLAQATAAGLILTSLLLLDFGLRRPVLSSVLAGLVAGLLLQHALVGWCLPLPLYRKMGFRTVSHSSGGAEPWWPLGCALL